jgi:hypothetical protein
MSERIRDAAPGVVLATIGVVIFASRLSRAPEPVGLASSLLVGFVLVVLVRLVLGMLASGNVILMVVGTGVGLFELLFLSRFHVSSPQSQANFVLCGLVDVFVMASAWLAMRTLRWVQKSRPGIEVGPSGGS